jgi:hypothetical protein
MLQLQELEQALQSGDSVRLMAVIRGAQADEVELAVVRQRGCPSLGWALREIRRLRPRRGMDPSLPLDRLALGVSRLEAGQAGFLGNLRLRDVAAPRGDYADFEVEFRREAQAIVLAKVRGLYAALCGFALAGRAGTRS